MAESEKESSLLN